MAEQIEDPETYLTPDRVRYMPRMAGIEERIEGTIGFHQYELCLLRTYWRTQSYFGKQEVTDTVKVYNHLMSLKGDVLRYCLPRALDWQKLIQERQASLVITPDYRSGIYYRYLANNLLLTDDTLVTRFLDFHLVNSVLKFKLSNDHSPNTIEGAYTRFIQMVDFLVVFLLQNDVPIVRNGVIQEVKSWIRKQMDGFSESQLVAYHKYEFNSDANSERHPYEEIVHKSLNTGCPSETIKAYFLLLTRSNPEIRGIVPFVSEEKVSNILYKWFTVGENHETKPDPTITLSRPQLLFFLYQFKKFFCRSRKKGMIQNEHLIRLAFDEFPDLFQGISFESQLDNFKRDALKGEHRSLDFMQSPDLKKLAEELKKP